RVRHSCGVVLVHLAAEGLDEVAAGLRDARGSGAKFYGLGSGCACVLHERRRRRPGPGEMTLESEGYDLVVCRCAAIRGRSLNPRRGGASWAVCAAPGR